MSYSLQNYGCCGCPSKAKTNPQLLSWGEAGRTVLVGAVVGGVTAFISSGKTGMPQGELAQNGTVVAGAILATFAGYYFGKKAGMNASASDLAKATGIPDILKSVMT
jgi:hypothetical protein